MKIDDYKKFVGLETVKRVKEKARLLQGLRVAHVNSTFYGGGVVEILSPLVLLMNSVGINTEWRVIQGSSDFFGVTKKMHNALQGGEINLGKRKKQIYESVVHQNAIRNHLDHDIVVIHDPQPLPMINHYRKKGPWIWRCHVDLSNPNALLWEYLKPFIEKYDAAVFSLKEYAKALKIPQVFIMPAIDPFCIKNKRLTEREVKERLEHYEIPTHRPLIVQISRFDRWKDPLGVIRAFKIASKKIDATLVLLGNIAIDDPEGEKVYDSLIKARSEKIVIISREDTALVNALQSRAAVVLQKSIREGFGLTVAEAMWKRTPVIGGNVGGIRHQIEDGVNGFLVSSVKQAAERIVQLVQDEKLRHAMGERARETVRKKFLLVHSLEKYLDFFNAFESNYKLNCEVLENSYLDRSC